MTWPKFFMKRKFTPGWSFGLHIISGHVSGSAQRKSRFWPFWPSADTYQPSGVLLCGNNVEMKCQNNVFFLFFFFIHPLFTPLGYSNFSPPTHVTCVDIHIYTRQIPFERNNNIDFTRLVAYDIQGLQYSESFDLTMIIYFGHWSYWLHYLIYEHIILYIQVSDKRRLGKKQNCPLFVDQNKLRIVRFMGSFSRYIKH